MPKSKETIAEITTRTNERVAALEKDGIPVMPRSLP
jgi:hypothetical protein